MQIECWVAANPQIKPVDLGCESAENWLLPSISAVAVVIITQPVCVCVRVRVRVRVCVCVVDALLTSLYSASSAQLSAWHCLHLVLSVVLRRHAARRPCRCRMSIDISCPQTAQQQTCHTSLLWWNDGTDGQTD